MSSLLVAIALLLPVVSQEISNVSQTPSVQPVEAVQSPPVVQAPQAVQAPSVAKRDQPIKINHPSNAKVQAIYADASSGSVVWVYLPEDHFQRSETYTVFAAPPGDYLITTGDSTILKIVDQGRPKPNPQPQPNPEPGPPDPRPNPQPEPEPQPEPQPEPGPKLKVNWAVWIYEQTDAINQIAQTNTRLSIETRNYLESRGIKMAAYDDDQEAAKAKPFRDVAGSLPSLVLVQETGKYATFPAPSSLDELKQIIEEISNE